MYDAITDGSQRQLLALSDRTLNDSVMLICFPFPYKKKIRRHGKSCSNYTFSLTILRLICSPPAISLALIQIQIVSERKELRDRLAVNYQKSFISYNSTKLLMTTKQKMISGSAPVFTHSFTTFDNPSNGPKIASYVHSPFIRPSGTQ